MMFLLLIEKKRRLYLLCVDGGNCSLVVLQGILYKNGQCFCCKKKKCLYLLCVDGASD